VVGTAHKPEDPKKIGRYEVEHLLGQGGMGRVWLARDTVLGRRVAIKVLRDDLALPPAVRDELIVRMGHEARAAAAVSHPNIVTLYDMGEDDVLGLFLVFEYVTSKSDVLPDSATDADAPVSLRDRLKRGPLSFSEVAKLAREVGSALTFAHDTGVIHRDVKPENILFSRNGFKIADFGIARIPDSTITRANTVLGTPAYTAPEALSKGDFSPASDQFSLAATLYEAATGARAFSGDDAIATAGKVSSEPPPPLHESIGPDAIVRDLDAALRRGLAKTPEARFASCAELGDEVARAVETDPLPRRNLIGFEDRVALPGAGRPLLTPPTGMLALERTPLSSRAAMAERVSVTAVVPPPVGDTPLRPSIFIRKRTHRFQNIAVAIAVITILVLVVVGRRTPHVDEAGSAASASASPSAKPPPRSAPPRTSMRPSPAPTTTLRTTDDGGPADDRSGGVKTSKDPPSPEE
jgi:eukaryotic-like serine/threonine-protein kinase